MASTRNGRWWQNDGVLISHEYGVFCRPARGDPMVQDAWEDVLSGQTPPFLHLLASDTHSHDRLTTFAKAWADFHEIELNGLEMPTEGSLARWLDSGEAHPEHILESQARLGVLCGGEGRWFPVVGKQNARLMAVIERTAAPQPAPLSASASAGVTTPDDGGDRFELLLPDDVFQRWESAPDDDDGQRPLNPMHPLLIERTAAPQPARLCNGTTRILDGRKDELLSRQQVHEADLAEVDWASK